MGKDSFKLGEWKILSEWKNLTYKECFGKEGNPAKELEDIRKIIRCDHKFESIKVEGICFDKIECSKCGAKWEKIKRKDRISIYGFEVAYLQE